MVGSSSAFDMLQVGVIHTSIWLMFDTHRAVFSVGVSILSQLYVENQDMRPSTPYSLPILKASAVADKNHALGANVAIILVCSRFN